LTKSVSHGDMNNEELINYVTSILDAHNITFYEFEVFKSNGQSITKTHFKSEMGWEISKRDVWDD